MPTAGDGANTEQLAAIPPSQTLEDENCEGEARHEVLTKPLPQRQTNRKASSLTVEFESFGGEEEMTVDEGEAFHCDPPLFSTVCGAFSGYFHKLWLSNFR